MTDVAHTDPLDDHAQDCADCGLHDPVVTRTMDVLSRLAPGLWNLTAPAEETTPGLMVGDPVYDNTIFGPTGSDDVTPQFEIARNLRVQKDRLLTGWRQMEMNQLALGRATVQGGQVTGDGIHARGEDLDRWIEQFGLGRPDGFTDCCLWRLFVLMLFKPGSTTWLLRELALLYTGIRPLAVVTRSKVMLVWPLQQTETFWADMADTNQAPTRNQLWGFYSARGLWSGAAPSPYTGSFDSFWLKAPADDANSINYVVNPAWSLPPAARTVGLTLADALNIVAPFGVAVEFNNLPAWGVSGCAGATYRATATTRGRWG